MSGVKNIIFDFGNVLFDIDLPKIETGFETLFGTQWPVVKPQLLASKIFELYETGGISTEEFLDTIRNAGNQPISAESVAEVWNSIFIGMPWSRFEMLDQLRTQYKVFLLSNINDLHATWIDAYMLRTYGLDDYRSRYFDGVYFSHWIRLRKPDRDIYEYVLADAELDATETLFFDDLEQNIKGAEQLGIRAILHSPLNPIEHYFSKV